ncbi:MAG: chemotaxis response regulator protein-glutamate methylesterase [Deltaproteobacteria bacterium]|nr:chemotaxis response regulator protein-glutamate methylesterase [Deltaproteobacteria bacterium]
MPRRPIRVLVVDDSAVVRTILREGLTADERIEVVGTARDAFDARDQIVRLRPDVMTLDIEMPRMDGVDFLRRLMPQFPLPVVMVSSTSEHGRATTMDALQAGAVDFVAKPNRAMSTGVDRMLRELRTKVKIASTANVAHWKVERAWPQTHRTSRFRQGSIVVIGASTGGTEAIRTVLMQLPPDFPPVLIVQHMPPRFTKTFASLLNDDSPLRVRESEDGAVLNPGCALVAPGGQQVRVVGRGGSFCVQYAGTKKVNGHCPSVDVMMWSAAKAVGRDCVGVLLTGMGADGARGLLAIRQAGGTTVAQDEATSVVYGMPREAYAVGGVDFVRPIERVAEQLLDSVSVN